MLRGVDGTWYYLNEDGSLKYKIEASGVGTNYSYTEVDCGVKVETSKTTSCSGVILSTWPNASVKQVV